jgi:hypothetical protein
VRLLRRTLGFYIRSHEVPVKSIVIVLTLALSTMGAAQESSAPPHHHDMGQGSPQDNMAGMNMDKHASVELPSPHEGSGTSWQPASVTGHEWMGMLGGWELMAHGVIFIDYNQQGGPRGAGKAESVNYGMLMEQHRLGSGTILFREMFSAESLTSPHPGFPEIFQDWGNVSRRAAGGSSASA